MEQADITRYGDELFEALRSRRPIEPLTQRAIDLTLDDAYRISRHLVDRRVADGEQIIGKKIGVTSKPVQDMLDVRQPDFGFLTDRMQYDDGAEMPIGRELIQPRAEGEIAFKLKAELRGPGVTAEDVVAATDWVAPCFEIVDSRIRDWKIRIQDTVSDNASSGLFLIGGSKTAIDVVDLSTAQMVMFKNGQELSRGTGFTSLTGSPKLKSPVVCVAWLANTLGAYGIELKSGEIILSGSLVPLEPVVPGDQMRLEIEGLGSAQVVFT